MCIVAYVVLELGSSKKERPALIVVPARNVRIGKTYPSSDPDNIGKPSV